MSDDHVSNASEDTGWFSSPSIRLISRNDESIGGRIERSITVAALVPQLPAPSPIPNRLDQRSGLNGWLTQLGLWRSADMEVTVTGSDGSPDTPLLVQISDRNIAGVIALFVCLYVIETLLAISCLVHYRTIGRNIMITLTRMVLGNDQRLTLAQLQLLLWVLLTIYAIIYFYVLPDLNEVPWGLLSMLGITATTYVAAKVLVEQRSTKYRSVSDPDRFEPKPRP